MMSGMSGSSIDYRQDLTALAVLKQDKAAYDPPFSGFCSKSIAIAAVF